MNAEEVYQQQVELLLDVLPFIKQETSFALKGGTAINLFERDMPRLSVDIDLTYLPIEPRNVFLKKLTDSMLRMTDKLEASDFQVIKKHAKQTGQLIKLLVSNEQVEIKIEPNLVLRGAVFDVQEKTLSPQAQEAFLQSQNIILLSHADLYAGKICAALDRQHPRDLFDIKLLFENEGITEKTRQAFVVYLASGPRPMSELLAPNKLDMRKIYETEFLGMTNMVVSYVELQQTREYLIKHIQTTLTPAERQFLFSIKQGEPDWSLMPDLDIQNLPALKWKVMNVQRMDKKKHAAAVDKLKRVLAL